MHMLYALAILLRGAVECTCAAATCHQLMHRVQAVKRSDEGNHVNHLKQCRELAQQCKARIANIAKLAQDY